MSIHNENIQWKLIQVDKLTATFSSKESDNAADKTKRPLILGETRPAVRIRKLPESQRTCPNIDYRCSLAFSYRPRLSRDNRVLSSCDWRLSDESSPRRRLHVFNKTCETKKDISVTTNLQQQHHVNSPWKAERKLRTLFTGPISM